VIDRRREGYQCIDAGGGKRGSIEDDCENAFFHKNRGRIISPKSDLGNRHLKLSSERTGEAVERKECCQTRV